MKKSPGIFEPYETISFPTVEYEALHQYLFEPHSEMEIEEEDDKLIKKMKTELDLKTELPQEEI